MVFGTSRQGQGRGMGGGNRVVVSFGNGARKFRRTPRLISVGNKKGRGSVWEKNRRRVKKLPV